MSVTENPALIAPADVDTKIWRFMDFTKFVSMLEESGLFFARLDRLGDPFEGSLPLAELTRRDEGWSRLGGLDAVRYAQDVFSRFLKWRGQWTYVNCWHINEMESAAMWKLYARTEEAICVQSTYARLRDCLNISPSCKNDYLYIGKVQYIDYQKDAFPDPNNLLHSVMHKRRSFEHERELRAVISRVPTSEPRRLPADPQREDFPDKPGVWVTINLEQLIEKMNVAPSSPSWFHDLVRKVVLRHKLDKQVEKSDLDASPLY